MENFLVRRNPSNGSFFFDNNYQIIFYNLKILIILVLLTFPISCLYYVYPDADRYQFHLHD
jgi:uncharacterized BrkB/YihY/UPF0761 family membrane protein